MNNKSESVCLKLTGGPSLRLTQRSAAYNIYRGGGATPLIIAHEEFQVDFQCTFR